MSAYIDLCEILHRYAGSSIVRMKAIIWMGGSNDAFMEFPDDARHDAEYQLERLRDAEDPLNWKPMKSMGPGTREIRIRARAGAFRVVYLATRPEAIYVLHCFQKKSPKTARTDGALARRRFKAIPIIRSEQ